MTALPATPLERIRQHLVGFQISQAVEALDASIRRLEGSRHLAEYSLRQHPDNIVKLFLAQNVKKPFRG
ncbi:MAG: hypothetical protein OEQ39_08355 [Gammaproteobacteria bacterium]|nr:hypothetical protein [Gammaproteobacteria bacterium]MDH3466050.1 hypothetical protein [Gammaproteobacteria bacterium]